MHTRGTWLTGLIIAASLTSAGSAFAADPDVSAELSALKARIAELEKKDTENWLTDERKSEIRSLVKEVIDDSRARGQFADGSSSVGYKDGFYITDGANYKLVIGGFLQARYSFVEHHQSNTQTPGSVSAPFPQGTTENANGFDIRRARINFSGYVFSPSIFYKLEGDFYSGSEIAAVKATTTPYTIVDKGGTTRTVNSTTVTNSSTSGNFVVTDAFIGYAFNDQFKVKAGSFKIPFTKVELMSDTNLGLMERPEENTSFDAQRSIGVSVLGDIMPDQWSYDFNINNGSNSNTFRRVDTASTSTSNPGFNLDNRMAFYARTQYSPDKISQFYASESDLRTGDRPFIWMLGGAVGYESQNANGAFAQNTAQIASLGGNDKPGYASAYILNGDLYRATIDWSAKYAGWSFLTAAYFQEVNANPIVATGSAGLPSGYSFDTAGLVGPKTSFFQHAYYGQVGYMLTDKIEVLGRAGVLLEEGDPNMGDFYTLGANYYIFGNNAKIQADVTYAPEAAFSDGGATLIQTTHEVAFRVQFQVKF